MLSFKEMKADLDGTLRRVADFLGVELTAEEFEAVVERCSFDYMKSVEQKFSPGNLFPWSTEGTTTIRRGRQGAANEMLTGSQQRRIDESFRAALGRLGSELDWERVCSAPTKIADRDE